MASLNQLREVPIIDIGDLRKSSAGMQKVANEIGAACRDCGFFYVVNHGVDFGLQERMDALSREFFSLDLNTKMQISMEKGGQAWRGFFPLGGELTSGMPDVKEGIYFGQELAASHSKVKSKIPLHGPNLFPAAPTELRPVVLQYMRDVTDLGHILMRGLALSVGLPAEYFHRHLTYDPLILFRIFHYPPPSVADLKKNLWGVGEHTDYGVLTILKQDECGGLQVKSNGGWVEAPPVPNSFICNIGDMLEKMTSGFYRSTPHRVENISGKMRLSFPLFFDPNFDAKVEAIPLPKGMAVLKGHEERWDKANVHEFDGTYGEYLLKKVGKVFPDLHRKVLPKKN